MNSRILYWILAVCLLITLYHFAGTTGASPFFDTFLQNFTSSPMLGSPDNETINATSQPQVSLQII
jgi:hypothetical protein